MSYQDQTLQCVECNCDFLFTAGEKEFYVSKGLINVPKRCPDCRTAKKKMSRRNSFVKRLYDIVCCECGCDTKVPFKPLKEKSVFCKECFTQSKTTSLSR